MAHQIEPIGLFSSDQVMKTWNMLHFDLDKVVGFPDTPPVQQSIEPQVVSSDTGAAKPTQPGDCVQVCGSEDCGYLIAVPGLGTDSGLTLTEKVAKDIFGDSNDYALQNASWLPAPENQCYPSAAETKSLKKRQWYPYDAADFGPPNPYGYGFDAYSESYKLEAEDAQLPIQYDDDRVKDYTENPLSPKHKSSAIPPPVNKNVKITNSNTGNLENATPSEIASAPKIANAALTDPPRRTVGPGTGGPKKNLNKGTTRRYPVDPQRSTSTGQSSQTESFSTDPSISFVSSNSPQDGKDVVTVTGQEEAVIPIPKSAASEPVPGALSESRTKVATPILAEDPAAPRMRKIEHPDGSIEYSFGVTSGEFNVYNEGEPVIKKPGRRHKSVISGLKHSINMDDDSTARAGWVRKAKRGLAPDTKPSAKNYSKSGPSEKGANFLRGPTSRQRGSAPKQQAPPPPQPTPAEPEPGSPEALAKEAAEAEARAQALAEADAKAEQAIQDYQKLEADRTRRLSLKAFYRGMDKQAGEIDLKRDKEAESQIKEESDRVAAENAQKRREERAKQQAEEQAKLDLKEKDDKSKVQIPEEKTKEEKSKVQK